MDSIFLTAAVGFWKAHRAVHVAMEVLGAFSQVQQASLLTALSEALCQHAVWQAVFSRTGLLRQAQPRRSIQGRPGRLLSGRAEGRVPRLCRRPRRSGACAAETLRGAAEAGRNMPGGGGAGGRYGRGALSLEADR